MKLIIELWSLMLPSTKFVFAHGEITSSGSLGPKPQRPCSPASGPGGLLYAAWQSPDVGFAAPIVPSAVLVRLSAGDCDWFVTPLKSWSYLPSESS